MIIIYSLILHFLNKESKFEEEKKNLKLYFTLSHLWSKTNQTLLVFFISTVLMETRLVEKVTTPE